MSPDEILVGPTSCLEALRERLEVGSETPTRAQARSRLDSLQAGVEALRAEYASLLEDIKNLNAAPSEATGHNAAEAVPTPWPLAPEAYQRYGRQLIMPEIGLQGQLRLQKARVLVVGAGGLGCPAAAYLAGAGVGKIGIVDGDVVEASNLHRQILHRTSSVGMSKADSLIASLRAINNLPSYCPYKTHLTPQNALAIAADYDLILDCTDRPSSRYLVSDTAVLAAKPLVSASALKTDGQLMVLNDPSQPPGDATGGPCYRCIFPKPPPPESVVSCGDGGILGPVVGAMGVLQALEAIKLLVRSPEQPAPAPSLLMLAALGAPPFRSVRLRGRRMDCRACSASATVTADALRSGSHDYVQFCGQPAVGEGLAPEERISALELARQPADALLVDVRERVQFELCSLPASRNVPFSEVARWRTREDVLASLAGSAPLPRRINVICRLGNDSQVAVRRARELGLAEVELRDVRGGLRAWRGEVDASWPDY